MLKIGSFSRSERGFFDLAKKNREKHFLPHEFLESTAPEGFDIDPKSPIYQEMRTEDSTQSLSFTLSTTERHASIKGDSKRAEEKATRIMNGSF